MIWTCTFFSSQQDDTIGFVGLGNMGAHMARNLLKNNKKVLVFDLSADAVKSVTDKGIISKYFGCK